MDEERHKVELRVLGPIEVYDGHKLAVGGPRQRRILAALAMHAGEVVSVDRLIDITWAGEEAPASADHNLRSYVHRIRTGLGEAADRLETSPPGYVLNLEADELDARVFEQRARDADRAFEDSDFETTLRDVDAALALWRGSPYGEFEAEEWVQAEVARLDAVRARLLERRAAALIELGRPDEALSTLDSLIDAGPFQERPRRLQMLALYHAGRQAEALRAFQDFRLVLIDEVGVEPSDELVQLERQILEQDPSLSEAPSRGRQLRGYELDEVIGEGAFAEVWRGTQPVLGREVAVKQIRPQLANDPDFIRRFEVEAQIVSSLEHPYVVPLYDYWREPDAAYLVMRMLKGGSLEARMLDGPLTDTELERLVEQIGAALASAHEHGIIHRDIKPGNILIDESGNYYLTDFGIAFGVEGEDDFAAALSTGSPAYASPEQLRRDELDARTDVYAFGVTLFEAATGQPPFADERTRAGLVRRQLEEPVPSPSSVRPGIAPWVDEVVAQATAKRPEDRFESMSELAAMVVDRDLPAAVPIAGASTTLIGAQLRNPFKGLRAFGEGDAGDFRGRQRLVARLVDALERDGSAGRFVAAVGPSGSGKSSVVRAGLVPALRTGAIAGSDAWFITTMIPGEHPFEELETALLRVAANDPGGLAEMMEATDRGIARAVKRIIPDEDAELLLVIDQFEELFTLVEDEADRRRFIDGLVSAVKERQSRLRVVVTIRADFWDRPLRYPALAAMLETAAVTVSPLSPDELESVIVDPVRGQGMEYEPGLVARITADVVDQPGALPLLQYTLRELFDRHTAGVLTIEAYEALGRVSGSIAARAEEVFGSLDNEDQATCRRLFGRLVSLGEGSEDTRRRVTLSELGVTPSLNRTLDAFGTARLLAFDRDPVTRGPTVEVAHEALLREWPRLRAWIDEDRDRLRVHRHLTNAAGEWDSDRRDVDELYRGARLEGASEIPVETLNALESEFLAESQAAVTADDERRRRRARILQAALVATAAFLVVALIAGLVAFQQRGDARDAQDLAEQRAAETEDALAATGAALAETQEARTEAEQQRESAEALVFDLRVQELGSLAVRLASGDPQLAFLLSLEVDRLAGGETARTAQDVAAAAGGWLGTIIAEWVGATSSGDLLVAGDGSLAVRSSDDLSIKQSFGLVRPVIGGAVAPVGDRVGLVDEDEVHYLDLASGELSTADLPEGSVPIHNKPTWTHDGRHFLVPLLVEQSPRVAVFREGSEPVLVDVLDPQLSIQDAVGVDLLWIDAHPSRPLVAVSSYGDVVIADTGAVGQGTLPVVERFTVPRPNPILDFPAAFANWSTSGDLYVATGSGYVAVNGVGGPEKLVLSKAVGDADFATALDDDRTFISNTVTTSVVTPAGNPIAGPWVTPLFGLYMGAELLDTDTLIAFHVNTDRRDAWRMDKMSLVGDSPLGQSIGLVSSGARGIIRRVCEAVGRNLTQAEWEEYLPPGTPYNQTCPQYPAGQ